MSSTSQRFAKAFGGFLVLAGVALAGCTTSGATLRQSAAPVASGYVVCSGGRASRFPEQEEVGRICRPSTSLQAIY